MSSKDIQKGGLKRQHSAWMGRTLQEQIKVLKINKEGWPNAGTRRTRLPAQSRKFFIKVKFRSPRALLIKTSISYVTCYRFTIQILNMRKQSKKWSQFTGDARFVEDACGVFHMKFAEVLSLKKLRRSIRLAWTGSVLFFTAGRKWVRRKHGGALERNRVWRQCQVGSDVWWRWHLQWKLGAFFPVRESPKTKQ